MWRSPGLFGRGRECREDVLLGGEEVVWWMVGIYFDFSTCL